MEFISISHAPTVPSGLISRLKKTPLSLHYLTIQTILWDLEHGMLNAIMEFRASRPGLELVKVLIKGSVGGYQKQVDELNKVPGMNVEIIHEGN